MAISKRKIKYLRAEVKYNNIASQVLFEKTNYVKRAKNGHMEFIKTLCREDETIREMDVSGNLRGAVLLLTNNQNAIELYEYLLNAGDNVTIYSDGICIEQVRNINPRFIISYNYRYIIDREVIEYMNGNIINLHISYLPWNRGSSPNFWSFIDNTPKGVTIHKISEELDTGDILIQKELQFDEEIETFKSSYVKLNSEIKLLFKDNWAALKENKVDSMKQTARGSSHTMKDLGIMDEKYGIDWNEKISDFKDRMTQALKNEERW